MTTPSPSTETPITFDQLGLSPTLLNALTEIGYETPSPIQAACIPLLMEGQDILGEAQTGTGKTAAFALPMLEKIDIKSAVPQVLVLTPTRELAIQVAEAFQSYARHMKNFHVLPLYGGQSMVVQLRQLHRGVQVVVGTPGRIMDHLERKSLNLDGLKTLVLDEADEMLRMGFIDDVEWILEHIPKERQTALFSATMPEAIRRVARQHLRQPKEVKIQASTATVSTIRQRYWQVTGLHKLDALTRILEVEADLDAAIIFVRTKTATVELADKLQARGYDAAALNGDMNQALRERTIEQLKSGQLDIVVATDVAARGIDVQRVSHVINYDIPYDTEAYVHRIGRTGRAGRQGSAILFVAPREIRMLRSIERATRQPITPLQLPTREAVAGRRVAQFKEQVLETLNTEDLSFFKDVVTQIKEENELNSFDIAAALVMMVQKERPLQLEESPRESRGGHERSFERGGERFSERGNERFQGDRESRRPAREASGDHSRFERNEQRSSERPSERTRSHGSNGNVDRYLIEVGRNQGAMPKDIVGALANEAGISSREIGQINLFPDYSTVELPSGLSKDMLNQLKRVRVRGIAINLRLMQEGEAFERPSSNTGWQDRPPRRSGPSRPEGESGFRKGPRGSHSSPFPKGGFKSGRG